MILHRTPFFLPLLFPSLVWRMSNTGKDLYLTFDDGPVSGPTEFVLEELHQSGIKATFFCIGDNVRKYPTVFEKVMNSGHAIGNHTFNHINGWKNSPQDYLENVRLFEKYLPDSINTPSIFRPPYGKITRGQIRALVDYRIIMWDVLSRDYDKHLSGERCLRKTIKASRPGSIIVFHDSYKAEKNLRFVLPRFIKHFQQQGYAFKTLTA
jgi:peptidoglycan-N-acetylglucosamine deacetylase